MQELEKILEEIDKIYVDDIGVGVDCNLQGRSDLPCDNCYECIKDACKDIIRKHMNDGWIPVEERLPDDEIPTPKLVTALVPDRKARWDTSETFSVIVDTDVYDPDYTGKWEFYKKNVIAWCPLPEPYRERSDDK